MIIGGVLPVLSNDAAEIKRLRKELKAAVKAEREACMGIVTGWREADWPERFDRGTAQVMADRLAERIRARGKEGE